MTTISVNKYYIEHTKYDNTYYMPGIIDLYFKTSDKSLSNSRNMANLIIKFSLNEGEFSGFMELVHINVATSIMLNDVILLHFDDNVMSLEIDLDEIGKLVIPLDIMSSKNLIRKFQLLYNDFSLKKVQKLY